MEFHLWLKLIKNNITLRHKLHNQPQLPKFLVKFNDTITRNLQVLTCSKPRCMTYYVTSWLTTLKLTTNVVVFLDVSLFFYTYPGKNVIFFFNSFYISGYSEKKMDDLKKN